MFVVEGQSLPSVMWVSEVSNFKIIMLSHREIMLKNSKILIICSIVCVRYFNYMGEKLLLQQKWLHLLTIQIENNIFETKFRRSSETVSMQQKSFLSSPIYKNTRYKFYQTSLEIFVEFFLTEIFMEPILRTLSSTSCSVYFSVSGMMK